MKRLQLWTAVALALLVGLMMLVSPALVSPAQGNDVNTLLDRATAFLGQQLGVTIAPTDIGRWRWVEAYWTDTSMGCPQPDQTYEDAYIHGYVFTIEYGGQFHAVHIVADSETIFLCGSQVLPTPTPYPTVVIPYDDIDALVALAREYLSQQSPTHLYFVRWTWEETVWPDDSLGCPYPEMAIDDDYPQRGYIMNLETEEVVFEVHVTGSGNRIMPCNLGLEYLPMISGVLVNPIPPTPEAGQQTTTAPSTTPTISNLFYTGPDGNVFTAGLDSYPGRNVTIDSVAITSEDALLPRPNHSYGAYRWSPDGTLLAFVDRAEPARLLLTDISGAGVATVVEGISSNYPPAWSPAGDEIAYVVPTGAIENSQAVMAVYAVAPPISGPPGAPRLLGTFGLEPGGGGGQFGPADELYMREIGYGGVALALAWLPGGQLFVSDDGFGIGLTRLDTLTGETAIVSPTVTRISLDPLGARIAGIDQADPSVPQLVTLDLAQGTQQVYTLPSTPDQVHWSADGQRLYVSTLDVTDNMAVDGVSRPIYTVMLWEINLATGQGVPRFTEEGRGIGVMTDIPGGGLVFSFIEGDRGWLEARAAGGDIVAQRAAAPTTWLMVLDAQGQLTQLGRGSEPSLSPLLPAMQG